MSSTNGFLNSIGSSQASVASLSLKTHLCSLPSNLSDREAHMETTALSLLSKLITRSVSVEVMLPNQSLAFCLWCWKKGEGSLMCLLITKPKKVAFFFFFFKCDACPSIGDVFKGFCWPLWDKPGEWRTLCIQSGEKCEAWRRKGAEREIEREKQCSCETNEIRQRARLRFIPVRHGVLVPAMWDHLTSILWQEEAALH